MEIRFNPKNNYIGATPFQHKLTKWIAKLYSDINFIAFKHDINYYIMLADKNFVIRLILKVFYDLLFLILGIVRLIKNLRFEGIIIVIILYLCLLLSSLNYLWLKRGVYINLTNGKQESK